MASGQRIRISFKRGQKPVRQAPAPSIPGNQYERVPTYRRRLTAWFTLFCWFFCGPAGVNAATNSATGGINGINNGTLIGGDGSGTAQIVINSVQLALAKEARDIAGSVLPDGSDVVFDQEIYFVLYVDNITDFPAYRTTIEDAIDETQFTYVPNSLETTSVASGSDEAARWAGIWTPQTDVLGAPDDDASILDSGGPAGADRLAVGEVSGQANLPLSIPAQTQWAIRFRVTVN